MIILLGFIFVSSCKKTAENYNVLIITIDTLRADRVGLYDKEYVRTPNIDQVGKDGSFFKFAFANVPVTLPSHTGIMSGLYPPTHNVRDNSGYMVNDKVLTIAKYLKKHNYETAAFIGAFPLDSRFGLNKGFDLYDDNYGSKNSNELFFVERKASEVIGLSLKWLKKRDKKWFAWIHLFDPHQPYTPPEPYKTEYKKDLYSGEAAFVDSQLKRLFDYLRENKLYEKTMIIITADHGEGLGEHGEKTHAYFAYNTTIHIPLIIKLPGKNKHNAIGEFVSHIDIFPTVCDELNIKIPKQVEGVSLLPLLKGEKKQLKSREIYFESLPPYLNRGWAPLTGYIDTKTKIKYIDQPIPELYDLKSDFNENKNLAKTVNITKYKNRLLLLVRKIKKDLVSENKKIKSSDMRKLQSLGYLSSTVKYKKSKFTKADDLKTLLPLQNEMLDGLGLYARGELEKSLAILSAVVKKRKDFVLVWNKIANIFRETGRINYAMATYEKALQYNKNNYNLLLNYGAFLAKYGLSDKAIEVLQKALKIIDYDPELWDNLGLAYWKNSDIEKAIDCFNKALELDNNNAIVYSNLGSMYLSFLLYDKAEKNLKKALELDSNLVDAINSYAALKKKKGDIKGAILNWEKILKINPKFFMAYYNLVSVYLDNGDYKKALEIYKKAKQEGVFNLLDPSQKRDFNKLYNDLEVYLNEN